MRRSKWKSLLKCFMLFLRRVLLRDGSNRSLATLAWQRSVTRARGRWEKGIYPFPHALPTAVKWMELAQICEELNQAERNSSAYRSRLPQ